MNIACQFLLKYDILFPVLCSQITLLYYKYVNNLQHLKVLVCMFQSFSLFPILEIALQFINIECILNKKVVLKAFI